MGSSKSSCGADDVRAVRLAWQLAIGRSPDADEERLAVELVDRQGLAALCRAMFNCNEFVFIE